MTPMGHHRLVKAFFLAGDRRWVVRWARCDEYEYAGCINLVLKKCSILAITIDTTGFYIFNLS